jgi:hypothetical protein
MALVREVGTSLPTCGAAVQRPHREPRLLKAGSLCVLAPNIAATSSFDTYPYQHAKHRDRHHDSLGQEQPLHLVYRDEQKRELDGPEHKISDQSLTSHSSRRRQVVGHRTERGKHGSDDLGRGSNSEVIGDRMPEHGSDKS